MPESTLSPLQQKALEHLAAGFTVAAAARALGLHRTTIHYWRRTSAEFRDTLAYMRQLQAEALVLDWDDLRSTAVDALHDLLAQHTTPPATRLRAAQCVLGQGKSGQNIDRLAELLCKTADPAPEGIIPPEDDPIHHFSSLLTTSPGGVPVARLEVPVPCPAS